MPSWGEFERADPELSSFGRQRLDGRVAFLATLRVDGGPRVHPVSLWFAADRCLVRMYPSSPKVRDLERDDRYAAHSLITDDEGTDGEFAMRGSARCLADMDVLGLVNAGKGDPERYVVFELDVSDALGTTYDGEATIRRRFLNAI